MSNITSLNQPLIDALNAREQFFESLPQDKKQQMIDLQEKIDNALTKAGNQNNRLTIIQTMMLESFFEMKEKLSELNSSVKQLDEECMDPPNK